MASTECPVTLFSSTLEATPCDSRECGGQRRTEADRAALLVIQAQLEDVLARHDTRRRANDPTPPRISVMSDLRHLRGRAQWASNPR
jgi:hypothetical protein